MTAFIRGLAIVAAAAIGMGDTASAEEIPPAAAPRLTEADVGAWLDGFMPYALARGDIAGAVVVVVKDGKILSRKGYGYADVARQVPVVPDRTLFRVASISKLFTWTAVMQQVEQGKLELDRDVNEYLDFQIPSKYDRPITLRHLMTHTAGFEETIKDMVIYDPTAAPDTETYLKTHIPPRIFAPGEVPAYSNYGTTLAGYIVQRVSGQSYHDYVERQIFAPLDMRQSTFRQPIPEQFAQYLAKGYVRGSATAERFEATPVAPAGSLSATGSDMAHFMIAHLREGRYGDRQLLRPETTRLMHAPAFQAIPALSGMTLGFFRADRNARRIIGHAGDTGLFHSDLRLYLDDGVGLFMSVNSTGQRMSSVAIRAALFDEFTDRYFPVAKVHEPTLAGASEHAQLIAGTYELSRRFVTSFMAAPGLLRQVRIEANEDGTVVVAGLTALNEQPKVWREIAPFVWRQVNGNDRLAAKVHEGRVVAISTEEYSGIMVFQPVPMWRSASWNVPILFGSLAVLVLTLVAWPVATVVRRRLGLVALADARERPLRRCLYGLAVSNLVLLAGWAFVIAHGSSSRDLFGAGLDPWLRILHLLGLVAVLGAIVAAWYAWLVFANRRAWITRLGGVLLAAAFVWIAWFTLVFKLITPSLNY